jgi:predicted permease
VLLVASGLLLESLVRLRNLDPGFTSSRVLTAQIDVPETRYADFVRRAQFFQAVLDHVRAVPGVTSAGFTSVLPFTWKTGMGGFLGMAGFQPEGILRPDIQYGALDRVVSPGYFETMRIRLLRGRFFDNHDGPDAPSVAIINQAMARKFWPDEDTLGKRFQFHLVGGGFRSFQIVGIVENVRELALDETPKEEMYFPFWQAQGNYMVPSTLIVHARDDTTTLANAVRQAVWSVDPDQPVSDIMTMDDVLDREVEPRSVQARLLGGLGALALTLAYVGIYGVLTYSVSQQKHEIGIRMALGATRKDILGLVLGRGAKMSLVGTGIGVISALALTRIIRSLLFGVSPTSPVMLGTAALLLTTAALSASYIPARRAMRVDPMAALRYE